MESFENFPPLTRHIRYALVRNQIVQNGEYRRKLIEIGREHRRKADEILHGRSQAVRDHVISSYQAAQSQVLNRKYCSRASISRDRNVMSQIKELSEHYISGNSEKLTPYRLSQLNAIQLSVNKLHHNEKYTNKEMIAQQSNFQAMHSNKNLHSRSRIRSQTISNILCLPQFKHLQKQSNQNQDKSGSAMESHSNQFQALNDRAQHTRSKSATNFQIRRRSRSLSISSMALIRLQNIQQISRLDPHKKSIGPDQIKPTVGELLKYDPKKELPDTIGKRGRKITTQIINDKKMQEIFDTPKISTVQCNLDDEGIQEKCLTLVAEENVPFKDLSQTNGNSNNNCTPKVLKSNLVLGKKSSNGTRKHSVWWSDSK